MPNAIVEALYNELIFASLCLREIDIVTIILF